MPHINITIDITEAQAEAVNRLRPARGRTTVLRMIEFLHAVRSEVDTVHVSAARKPIEPKKPDEHKGQVSILWGLIKWTRS